MEFRVEETGSKFRSRHQRVHICHHVLYQDLVPGAQALKMQSVVHLFPRSATLVGEGDFEVRNCVDNPEGPAIVVEKVSDNVDKLLTILEVEGSTVVTSRKFFPQNSQGLCEVKSVITYHLQWNLGLAGDVSIPEYVVDIEISFPNASLLDDIRNYIKSLSYPIPLNTSSSVNITSINITTACKLIGSDLQCSCENSYEWPSSVCSAYKSCSASSGANCTCITELPPHGSYCQPKKVVDIKMTIKIKEDFTPDFNNPSSTKYKDYKSKLETAFNDAYKSLPGFKSATVTGFRPGSVAADYTIVAEPVDNSTFQAANTNLVGNLQKSFTLSDPPIQNRVDGLNNITVTPNEIFSGDTVTFECKVLATYTTVNWYINETQRIPATPRYTIVSGASVSTLTITNFTKTDIGSYHCIMDEGSNSYVANVNTTTIQPLKISVKNEELTCNNAETPILTCCTEGESTSFSFTCSSDFIKGTFYCKSSDDNSAQANKTVAIYKLISKEQIVVTPIENFYESPTCTGPQGIGVSDATVTIDCSTEDSNLAGNKTYRCVGSTWVESLPTGCVSAILNRLSFETSELTGPGSETKIPTFVEYLNSNVTAEKDNITSSPNNIQLVVNLLSLVDNAALVVEKNVMMNFLQTVSIVVDDNSTGSWNKIENKTDKSSLLLQSVESFGRKLQFNTNTIEINEPNVKLLGIVKTNDTTDYNKNFAFSQGNNLTGSVSIGQPALDSITGNATIVSIAYATLKDILPNTLNDKNETLNALVMTTVVSANYTSNFQISMVFQKSNKTLNVPQCVFWNFTIKSWDSSGCKAIKNEDNVSCICDHLTSFSILMSYEAVDNVALDYITYIGVGISIISLVICILVEITVWKSVTKNKTSYMRHICLVNIAVSLLIADIWFIVGAGVSTQLSDSTTSNTHIVNACVAATFFTHIFYLSLFFWMLTMGLILFYRLVYVLHDMSKTTMMAISFCTGYGFPLIISVITIAVTQPKKQYTAEKSCWLNFKESKAFIAFVVPALIIIVVNFIILLVVIVKLLRPSIGDKPRKEEKSTLIHIGKSIAILTPLLGLTWGFGIGTIANNSVWVHGIFAALNSLQGLFILLFGCLLDRKVRDGMFGRLSISRWSSQQTKSNTVSTSEIPFSRGFINIFSKKGAYNISSAQMSSSSDTPSNVYSLLT
ncbi:adhesion G protein-coupled receptor F5-like [Rhinophrynus dorsalis]